MASSGSLPSDSYSDSGSVACTYDSERNMIVRGKWVYDGCDSLQEMIRRLELEIEYLKMIESQGWRLQATVDDDYAFLVNDDNNYAAENK
jgi:hypothetical protein